MGRVRLSALAEDEPLEDAKTPFQQQPADRTPAAAPPAPQPPAPAPAAPPQAATPEPPAAPAPARRRAPARSKPAEPARPERAARQQPAGRAATRSAPQGYDKATKPLQVFVESDQHWTFKDWCHLNRVDMRRIGSELVAAFNHSPDLWYQLMMLAEEQRVPLGELLAPFLEQALAGEEDPE